MRYRQWGNLVFLLDHGCTLTGVIVPLNYGSIVATSDLYRQLKSTMRLFWIESFPHGTLMPDMPSVAELILIIAVIILTTDKLAYAAHSGAECYLNGHRIYVPNGLNYPRQAWAGWGLSCRTPKPEIAAGSGTTERNSEERTRRVVRLVDAATSQRTLLSSMWLVPG
jgi:hypothetical protein